MTKGPAETEAVGERLGRLLADDPDTGRRATVLLLHGPLGAGKTCFVRGLARGLGCAVTPKSPTFALHVACPGRRVLHHLDLYRLEAGRLDEIGLEEIFAGPGVAAVEWGEKLGTFRPAGAIDLTFEIDEAAGEDVRRLRMSGPAASLEKLAAGWVA